MSKDKGKQRAVDELQALIDKAAKDPKTTDQDKLSNAAAMDEVRKKLGTE